MCSATDLKMSIFAKRMRVEESNATFMAYKILQRSTRRRKNLEGEIRGQATFCPASDHNGELPGEGLPTK